VTREKALEKLEQLQEKKNRVYATLFFREDYDSDRPHNKFYFGTESHITMELQGKTDEEARDILREKLSAITQHGENFNAFLDENMDMVEGIEWRKRGSEEVHFQYSYDGKSWKVIHQPISSYHNLEQDVREQKEFRTAEKKYKRYQL
jgi:hypothetical protein